jgi:DNA-binding transcriptional LysR family regulator
MKGGTQVEIPQKPTVVVSDIRKTTTVVVMGRSAVVRSDVASGRLVDPFSIRLSSPLAYHIVAEEHRARLPKVAMFVDWLLGAFKKMMSDTNRRKGR